MKIRFCEFCSNVVREDVEYCDICGGRLGQEVEEEQFNAPGSKWPFRPLEEITLRIQGQDRRIHFDGTHSVYHLWTELHRAYSDMNLWFRERNREEMELASFPAGQVREGFRLMEPGYMLNCTHSRFSCFTCSEPDPELAVGSDHLEVSYQASFQLLSCTARDIPCVLGWLLATAPRSGYDHGWLFEI